MGSALLVLLVSTSSGAQTSEAPFIVKMYEADISLDYRGVTVHNCAVVLPNGVLHLEVRKQQLPEPSATLSIYDQLLSEKQLDRLNSIIKDERISKLPSFEQPVRAFTVPHFRGFNTTIPRTTGPQTVGFFAEERDGQISRPSNFAEDEMRERWKQSETILRPLVNWLHDVASLQLSKSTETSNLCISDR